MSNNIEITTYNQAKDSNGGYHELYSIKFLSSPEHALTTVKNIIDANIQYGNKDCILEMVDIDCGDYKTYQHLKEYYNKYSDKEIKIRIGYNPGFN